MEITRQICNIFEVQIHELAWSLFRNSPHHKLGTSEK